MARISIVQRERNSAYRRQVEGKWFPWVRHWYERIWWLLWVLYIRHADTLSPSASLPHPPDIGGADDGGGSVFGLVEGGVDGGGAAALAPPHHFRPHGLLRFRPLAHFRPQIHRGKGGNGSGFVEGRFVYAAICVLLHLFFQSKLPWVHMRSAYVGILYVV